MIYQIYKFTCDAANCNESSILSNPERVPLYSEPLWPVLPYGWRQLGHDSIICPKHEVKIDGFPVTLV